MPAAPSTQAAQQPAAAGEVDSSAEQLRRARADRLRLALHEGRYWNCHAWILQHLLCWLLCDCSGSCRWHQLRLAGHHVKCIALISAGSPGQAAVTLACKYLSTRAT